jgi:hypothetical protein
MQPYALLNKFNKRLWAMCLSNCWAGGIVGQQDSMVERLDPTVRDLPWCHGWTLIRAPAVLGDPPASPRAELADFHAYGHASDHLNHINETRLMVIKIVNHKVQCQFQVIALQIWLKNLNGAKEDVTRTNMVALSVSSTAALPDSLGTRRPTARASVAGCMADGRCAAMN